MSDFPPAATIPRASRDTVRRFLFLQGPIGGFFNRLARRLGELGHPVHRINFNGGDRLFWNASAATDYRGGAAQWPSFLERVLDTQAITDIVLFGDCRPLHQAAIQVARRRQLAVHVCEEGYLRPNWLTLERGGVNRYSALSRDPAYYRLRAQSLPPWHPGQPVINSFARRALADVLYRVASGLLRWRYPHYRTHKPWSPVAEYRSGARRFLMRPAMQRRSAALTAEILAGQQPYYLLPLQLEADSQIRFHSAAGSLIPAIAQIIASFARHAPADSLLVVTEHPLDTGVVDLGEITLRYARDAGVADRLRFLHGGSPESLLRGCRAVVTVNSTIGILAMNFGRPLKALGSAIYDLPGLTFQGPLDDFWLAATPPDPTAFDCFRRVVAAESQINGGLFCRNGLRLAVEQAAQRLSTPLTTSNTMATAACRALDALALQAAK